MRKKNIKISSVIALVIGASLFCACGSSSSKSKVCPVCKQSLEGKKTVKATVATGDQVRVCVDCYRFGKANGMCL